LKRNETYITFWGTISAASILIWSLSQTHANPEQPSAYLQIQTLPKPTRRAEIRIAPALQRTPAKRPFHLVKDVTIKSLCKLRKYAAVKADRPVYQLASKEVVDEASPPAELKVTQSIGDIMNKIRPKQITGIINVAGKEYEFGSGGRGQSIPYGDYLITPGAVGSWGSRHGAIGVADGTIPDPKLHRDRDGIELHAATNSKLATDGCVSIRKDQWPEFRKQVLAMVEENKRVYLHVSDQGASVSTDPLGFIGETVSQPTIGDVLSMIEEPVRKASD
jgi:hypothetical protein